jgi:uncharacterized protein (DUF58 family)
MKERDGAAGRVGEFFGDPDFLKKLVHLDLVAKQIFSGASRGERRSRLRGAGTVFSDYRAYSRGDDLRYVDWNIFARLGQLFVKEYEIEESANVLVLLDRSSSMRFGEPDKLDFAVRVAAALGYIGLAHLDRVEILPISGGEARLFSGKAQAAHLFRYLEQVEPRGETDLLASIRRRLATGRRRGLAILISDFLDPAGYQPAVDLLLGHGHRVFVVHIVAPQEETPVLGGSVRLLDSETGRRLDVKVDKRLLEVYRKSFKTFCRRLERFSLGKEMGHALLRTDLPFDEAILSLLRRGGVVR